MAMKFHTLRVREVRPETHDTVSIALEIPDELRSLFAFAPGQYLTFRKQMGEEEVRRSYSICAAPADGEWRVAVKKVRGGLFSVYANEQLRAGDLLEVTPPEGRFCPTEVSGPLHYVLFAAGSGITPVLSIVKSVLETRPDSRVTLFYSNRSSSNIIFKEPLEALKNKYIGRLALHYLLSREKMDAALFQGRIDGAKCADLCRSFPDILQADDFFLCGPFEMIQQVRESLQEQGVPSSKIHFELFTPAGAPVTKAAANLTEEEAGRRSQVSVKLDGVTIGFELEYDGQNILDAALANGADLPFSCKGGVCSTCRARLVDGQVEMDVNYALEQDEIEDGFILTCQAHPRTELVFVDFDQQH